MPQPTPPPGQSDVIMVTTDTVPGRRIVQVHWLITAESDRLDKAQNGLISQAHAVGANAVVGFRWAADHGLLIAYGTAVTIE